MRFNNVPFRLRFNLLCHYIFLKMISLLEGWGKMASKQPKIEINTDFFSFFSSLIKCPGGSCAEISGQVDSVSMLSSGSISSVQSVHLGLNTSSRCCPVSSQMQPPHSLAGILSFLSIMNSRLYDPLEVKSLTLLSPDGLQWGNYMHYARKEDWILSDLA